MSKCRECGIEVEGKWICKDCSKGLSATDLLRKMCNSLYPNNEKAKEFTEDIITTMIKRGLV